MSLENLHAVKERIEDIRRRFVDFQEPGTSGSIQARGADFGSALRRAQSGKHLPCPDEIEPMISRAAEKHGLDPAVLKALVRVESGFRSNAVSRVGAIGLTQLMPGTAREMGVDPNDPVQNLEGGARYLKQQIDRFGSLEHALAAYNAGPGSVVRHGGIPPYAETQRYVVDVLRYAESYAAGS